MSARRVSVLIGIAVLAPRAVLADAAANPFLGTWEYDAAASSFSGRAPYRSARLTFEESSGAVRVTADVVVANGRLFRFHYTGAEDGTVVAVTGNPYYDSASTVRVDARTIVRTERRGGQVTGTTTMKVAEDGGSLMATAGRSLPEGGTYSSVITWRRADARTKHALLGTWKFDPAASRFVGGAAYVSGLATFTARPTCTRVAVEIVEARGQALEFEYCDAGDGTFAPVRGNPFYDSEATRWPDLRTAIRTERRAGEIIGTTTMRVAADGASYVATSSRIRPDGVRYDSAIVWRRVPHSPAQKKGQGS